MEPSDFGRRIDASEAHGYVENYKELRNTLIEDVLPWVPDYAPQEVKDSATFHKSKANAFLFDAALVRSLLDESAPTYLAVFIGAIGLNPTVIVTPLKEGPQPNTLILIREDDSSGEHPGILVNVKFPSNDNGPITVPE